MAPHFAERHEGTVDVGTDNFAHELFRERSDATLKAFGMLDELLHP